MIVSAVVAFKVLFLRGALLIPLGITFFHGEVVSEKAMHELDGFMHCLLFISGSSSNYRTSTVFLFERCTSTQSSPHVVLHFCAHITVFFPTLNDTEVQHSVFLGSLLSLICKSAI